MGFVWIDLPDGSFDFRPSRPTFRFFYRSRTKTRPTWVNFKKCPILNSKGFLCLLCPRKVEIILSDMVFAMKIFARVARVARVSDLALFEMESDSDDDFEVAALGFVLVHRSRRARSRKKNRRRIWVQDIFQS